MQKKVQEYLGQGDKRQADGAIADYEKSLTTESAKTGLQLNAPEVGRALSKLKGEISDAFSGAPAEQELKQKRLAKEQHQEAINNSRK